MEPNSHKPRSRSQMAETFYNFYMSQFIDSLRTKSKYVLELLYYACIDGQNLSKHAIAMQYCAGTYWTVDVQQQDLM